MPRERFGRPDANQSENILRDYVIGAQILLDLGVRDLHLLTDGAFDLAAVNGFGLRVVGCPQLSGGASFAEGCACGSQRADALRLGARSCMEMPRNSTALNETA